ncbi:hypothetical protein BCR34DRAFT_21228 [Clohesyomyces aquaticus]|uniref:Uncharacterized protein n=1 Tax=Clohesyomyces aquaticus TaxID=1231657 RepID=A0A1Y1ZC92_9PLEO|nr:hypothetical protein BCR34DRAFT_21228 [Clohesyomyces aquaticus]
MGIWDLESGIYLASIWHLSEVGGSRGVGTAGQTDGGLSGAVPGDTTAADGHGEYCGMNSDREHSRPRPAQYTGHLYIHSWEGPAAAHTQLGSVTRKHWARPIRRPRSALSALQNQDQSELAAPAGDAHSAGGHRDDDSNDDLLLEASGRRP